MIYFCSQKNRRALVLQHPTLNGIDYLEVPRGDGDCGKQLLITLLKDASQPHPGTIPGADYRGDGDLPGEGSLRFCGHECRAARGHRAA